jgi:uncharacterized protein YkwD
MLPFQRKIGAEQKNTTHLEIGNHKLRKPLAGLALIAILLASFYLVFENLNPSSNLENNSPTHEELIEYALFLINSDRQTNGLQNITLSSVDAGQQHANEMLQKGYFSHWNVQGYKPYTRYTLAGGKGAVSENIGLVEGWSTAGMTEKQALNESQWSMMNDDAAWNWEHKDNILNPIHNKVSIGIAYDQNYMYFVEDFENDYISWIQLNNTNNQVMMQGKLQRQHGDIKQIAIFYDNPSPLTASQLEQAPYQSGYDAGTYVGSVLPPNWQAAEGITITADNWYQNGDSFRVSFSLLQAIEVHAHGVYTLYLETGNSTADSLTTYSLFV